MQEGFFSQLLPSLSVERLMPYRTAPYEDGLDVYAKYLWNIAVSESFYPSLNTLEITLRNNIYVSICENFHRRWLDDCDENILCREEINIVTAKKRILKTRYGQTGPYEGHLVAELNLGFWTSLFNAEYERRLWRRLLADRSPTKVFPAMPRSVRTRKTLSTRLNDIRTLRNRIFHHEPIWYDKRLSQKHDAILEVIYWINPTLRASLVTIDRFPEVYSRGFSYYRRGLDEFLRSSGYF